MVNAMKDKKFMKLQEEINDWFYGEKSILTICSRPLWDNFILYGVINEVLKNDGKVLYIWGNSFFDSKMIYTFKLSRGEYSYSREDINKSKLQFMNTKYIYNISEKYDLIIVDEISSYTRLLDSEYMSLYIKLRKYTDKVIFYSFNKFSKGKSLDIRESNGKEIFIQPRVILTRVNLNYDIPFSIYDYINWYKMNKKNLALYIPNERNLEEVFIYYTEKLKLNWVKVVKEKEKVLRSYKESTFLITSDLDYLLNCENIDGIIVLQADDRRINYKKILFLCSKVGLNQNGFSEVILACNEETFEIENSLKMIRKFNKKLWD